MEIGENMTFEELKNKEEVKVDFDSSASEVNEGICVECGEKLIKIVENRSIPDGAITFHIIKLRCLKCGKEYLDLHQAEKYDFLFSLENAIKQKRLLFSLQSYNFISNLIS